MHEQVMQKQKQIYVRIHGRQLNQSFQPTEVKMCCDIVFR